MNGSESVTESVRNAFPGGEDCIQVFIEPPRCTPHFGFLARANATSCDSTLTSLSLRASPVFDPSIRIGYSDIRILIGSRTSLTTAHGLFPDFDGFPASYYTDILYTATAVDICGRVATRQIIAHYDCPPFYVIAFTHRGNDIRITVNATAGFTYRLERKLTLTEPDWQSIPGVADVTAASNGPALITAPGAFSLDRSFYRVRLLP